MQELKAKITEGLKELLFFSKMCSHPDSLTSDDYFNEIAYNIDLTKLYKVKDVSYYNNKIENAPILLEITSPELIQHYDGHKYLIQVWDQWEGKKFEKALKGVPKTMQLCYNYLVYIPSDEDHYSSSIHVVDLESDESNTILVKNVVKKFEIQYISYNQYTETLLVASHNALTIVNLPKDSLDEPKEITIEDDDLTTIEFEAKVLGLFLSKDSEEDDHVHTYIMFETTDNQLDFNKFEMDFEGEGSYTLKQARELVPRSIRHDPIVSTDFVLKDNVVFAIALRQSGEFDLYWDMIKVQTPPRNASRVAVNHTAFYIEIIDTKDAEKNGDIFTINTKSGKPDFTLANRIPKIQFNFDDVLLKKVRQQVKLFTNFQIQQNGHDSVVKVAHGKFVSTFDLVKETWTEHKMYEDKIQAMFRTERWNGTKWIKAATVLLDNGEIHYEASEGQEAKVLKIEGEIKEIEIDSQNNMIAYIAILDEDAEKEDKKEEEEGEEGEEKEEKEEEEEAKEKYKLKVLFREELFDLDIPNLNEDSNLVPVKNDIKEPILLVQDNYNKITLYQIRIDQGDFEADEFGGEEDDTTYWDDDVKDTWAPGTKYTISFEPISNFKNDQVWDLYYVTCAATTDKTKNLFLFTWYDLHVIDIAEAKQTNYEDQVVIGMQFFSSKEVYGICSDPDYPNLPPGLRLYNLERILERKECKGIPVKRLEVGAQDDLEFNNQVNRVGFIQSITDLTLTPLLHRNTIRFFGMQAPEAYVAYKVKQDKLITLTYDRHVSVWNIISGKLVSTHRHAGQDYSQFDVYSKYKNGKVILVSKDPIEDVNEDTFFQEWQLRTTVSEQVPYVKGLTKTIRHIKVVEVIDQNEVREHLNFYWPKVSDQQKFYFSENNEFMIERVDPQRVYLYQAIHSGDLVKWQQVKKIEAFPDELQVDNDILNFYSPDFTLNLDINKREKVFYIKDTLTNQLKYTIPDDLMHYDADTEGKQDAMRRFKWLNDCQFIVINEEGDEKIIDYTDNFKTVAYNSVPELQQSQITDGLYYFGQDKVDIGDTLERLKRKNQQYKSAYFLEGKRRTVELYSSLFTVDPYRFDYADHSFTFLDWNIIEQFNYEIIDLENLDMGVIENLLFNILPGGQTLLHLIADQEEFLGPILDDAHPEVQGHITKKYYTPVNPNFEGKTPLHILLELNKNKMANKLLKVLTLYNIDHHSRAIKDIFPELIRRQMSELYPYMESRIQQDQQVKSITKLSLDDKFESVVESELWFNQHQFESRVESAEAKFERNVKLEFLDLPSIYHQLDPNFQELFDTLAENDDFSLYNQKLVQKIIDFNYPIVRTYTVRRLFMPFLIFLGLYEVYTNYVYWKRYTGESKVFWNLTDTTFLALLSLMATYFFANEVKQLIRSPIEYFTSIWNYIDLIPTVGIYTLTAVSLVKFVANADPIFISNVMAITTFFMWMKMLYFLRLFSNTSYLIHMIIQVIIDMRHFMLILLITIIAFGDSLLAISLTNQVTYEGDEQVNGPFTGNLLYAIGYTYIMILGGFSTSLDQEGFGQESLYLVWTFFILCTIFNMIVMLNLLIAIISESFAAVNSNAQQAAYQVRAAIIAENNYLIPQSAKEEYAKQNGYLLIITDNDAEVKEGADPVQQKLTELKQLVEKQVSEVTSLKDIVLAVQTKIDKMEEKNTHESIIKNLEAIIKAVKKGEDEEKKDEAEGEGKVEGEEEY